MKKRSNDDDNEHGKKEAEEIRSNPPEVVRPHYKGSNKLLDKVALVTGGDSGIGRSVAVLFAREGCDVAIVFHESKDDAQETKKLVEKEGRKCLLLQGDLGEEKFAVSTVEQTVKEYGKINIVVNNAAEQHQRDHFEDIKMSDMEATFRTNIFAYFYVLHAAVPHLKRGDCIINTTSVTAYRGSEHLIDYSSTKGAIVTLTRSLALNLASKGIRVNGVAPGPIWTPLIPKTMKKEDVDRFGEKTPMGRPGQPSECAPAYAYLASDDSTYVTGQVIHINGGEVVNA